MKCVKTQQMIRPYLDGVLSDRELEEFLDHVQNCKTCFGELEVYFSIYRTLNNVDEQGDYNYARKLRAKLRSSREYLHVRQRNKVIKVGVILAAEVTIAASFYALFRMPGGYLDRHRTEIIPVVETERTVQGSQAVPVNQMPQTQGGQAVPENQIPQTQGNQAVLANQTPQTQENQPMQEQDNQTPQAG